MAKPPGILALAILIACALAGAARCAELTVTVTGLRSAEGMVHIAVYDRPETFPESEGMLEEVKVPILNNRARHTFRGLQPAFYAVAVYHDENGNRDFDTNLIGLPLEGYAFSNDAGVFLGPPSFAEAKIALPTTGAETVIRITY